MLNNKIGLDEEDKIVELLNNIKIDLSEENGKQKVMLNGEDVTLEIRTPKVNEFVSPVSKLKIVRQNLLVLQRKMAEGKNVIMEGRDIGTAVFPNADVKIYLDATAEERARRRVKQNEENNIEGSYEEILKSIKSRDEQDSNREIAPLKKAEDAIYLDSTNLNIDEVVEKIIDIIKEKMK
jgi:cytidylate kinase